MTPFKRVVLTAALVEAFAGAYLSPLYDNPAPTPAFHRECWELYCNPTNRLVAVAAPRHHAKSTSLTHDFILAVAMWRSQDYIIIVSATEALAIDHLGDIAKECRENDDLIRDFQITGLSTDSKTDIVVDFADGHQCRIRAFGSGQRMRGLKWHGKRPGLIIGDDLEEDEQVENIDRRKKFARWVNRALIPLTRKGGLIRIHGTILHEDSYLSGAIKSPSWISRLYKAHAAFDDFSAILWPVMYDEAHFRAIRQQLIDAGDADGYAQEYLNDPTDHSQSYLRSGDLIPMDREEGHYDSPKRHYVGCDFAVSKADAANRSSFTVGGLATDNLTHIVDQYVGRWDTLEWIEVLFSIEAAYSPDLFYVEDGVIWKSVYPMILREMMKRGKWMNFQPILPIKDKAVRGRSLQKRTRAHAMRFDTEAAWWEDYRYEILKFTGVSDALRDDQFDSTAILVKGLETAPEVEDEDFDSDDEVDMRRQDPRAIAGRSTVTGY